MQVESEGRGRYSATTMVVLWLEGFVPTTLTLKNIPDDLYERLKQAASVHRRSLNGEAIVCLERVLVPTKIPVAERLERVRRLRAELAGPELTDADIDAMKRDGRA